MLSSFGEMLQNHAAGNDTSMWSLTFLKWLSASQKRMTEQIYYFLFHIRYTFSSVLSVQLLQLCFHLCSKQLRNCRGLRAEVKLAVYLTLNGLYSSNTEQFPLQLQEDA